MDGLASASNHYLEGEIYNSQFEAWVPKDNPNVQAVSRDWALGPSSMGEKKGVVPVEAA